MARNALLGFALLAATSLTLGGCSGKADEAQAADAQLAALRAHTDSLRKEHVHSVPAATADSTVADSASLAATPAVAVVKSDSAVLAEAEAALADSVSKAREIEVMRETFAYAGGTRDPFSSLINSSKNGPEIADLDLVGVYQDLRSAIEQRGGVAGEGLQQASQDARWRSVEPGPAGADPGPRRGVHDSGLRVRAPGNSLAAQAGGRHAMTGLYRLMLVAAAALGAASPVLAEGPGSGEVTAVSLSPAAGKTEVVVTVQGAVEVRDFMLNSPDRLVLDVVGAHLNQTARDGL